MLCALLLKQHVKEEKKPSAFARRTQAMFDGVMARYGQMLNWVLVRQRLTLVVALSTLAFTALLYILIPKGFFPVQDTGLIQGISEAGGTVSYAAMAERQQAMAAVILKDPDVGACHPSSVSMAATRR